jgi:predicted GNAT superfamily acetyltransferase
LFVVAAHTGGQVLGAFDGERLVGYTLALAGVREGGIPYLHSHMTGVQHAYRDRGVGRMLKLFQRDEALSRDIRLIRWTFDPLEFRNAFFNLNRLGAICRKYLPNLYGMTTSPLHRGLPTDRLLAEWQLDSPRVAVAAAGLAPQIPEFCVTIDMPPGHATSAAPRQEKQATASLQGRLREQFTRYFNREYAAVAVRNDPVAPAYLLCPWSDF